MRVFSFAQESTRYCNYSKDKFGNEVTFIIPCWLNIPEGSIGLGDYDKTSARYKGGNLYDIDVKPPYVGVDFIRSLCEAESYYLCMVKNGWTPQQARAVLPNALKTELVMTGFVDDWWGEYLVIDKATGLIDQRMHGKFYTELDNIDREKYRIIEKGFFPLRCSSGAHPQAQELAIPLREEFVKRGY